MSDARYARMLRKRMKEQLRRGEEDAMSGKPPAMDELAYIKGYEQGLVLKGAGMVQFHDIDTL
jgi:hypothetical protein